MFHMPLDNKANWANPEILCHECRKDIKTMLEKRGIPFNEADYRPVLWEHAETDEDEDQDPFDIEKEREEIYLWNFPHSDELYSN